MSNYPLVPISQVPAVQGSIGQGPTRQGRVTNIPGSKTKVRKPEGLLGRGLGGAFVAFDSYSRIKAGEAAPVAIGKAVLSNALFMSMGPVAGTAAALGLAAASMAPAAISALDGAKSNHGSKGTMFGGKFAETEGQSFLKQMGMSNMAGARQQAASVMSGHAMGASKSY